MKVFAAFMVFSCIINVRGKSVLRTLRRGNIGDDRYASVGNDLFDTQDLNSDDEKQERYYGFKTVKGFPYKQNSSRSLFDMFTSSGEDSAADGQESSEEYFNTDTMYIGSYNEVNQTYSDVDGPDSGETQYGVQPISEELFISTPATLQRHKNVPSLRSSVAGATKYCEEACNLYSPCHARFCAKLSLSTLWKDCESRCLSFFLLFRAFLKGL